MSLRSISISKLYITVAVYSLVANFAHPITPTFIQELGLNDYMFGVAFACMSLTNFLFSPFWGKISHNFGVVKTMGFCYVGYALSQLAFGLSTSELVSASSSAVSPSIRSSISWTTHRHKR